MVSSHIMSWHDLWHSPFRSSFLSISEINVSFLMFRMCQQFSDMVSVDEVWELLIPQQYGASPMSKSAEELLTKVLHPSDPWEVLPVNIDVTETGVDIRIHSEGNTGHGCPDCGCSYKVYDERERTRRHTDFFDMDCYLHCTVPRMRCPWAQGDSCFTVLFEGSDKMWFPFD